MSREMNTYFYRVLLPEGTVRSGVIRLSVDRDFSARLRLERQYDGTVLDLQRLPAWLASAQDVVLRPFRPTVRAEDLAGFLRDLALMTGAGVPMIDALRAIEAEDDEVTQSRLSGLAQRLLNDLNAGASVSEAFMRHPDVFPETVRNLVSIGEQSGNMDRMLLEAAKHIERNMQIRRDIRTALIYPVFVFMTILAVAGFWIYNVVPNMAQLFKQLNAKLPPITIALVNFADLINNNAMLWLSLLIGGGILFWLAMKRIPGTRHMVHRIGHRLPVTKLLMRSAGLAHITEHLAILIRAGLDIVTSLDVLARATGDTVYQARIVQLRARVARGERIGAAMRKIGGFPAMVTRMISVGEESGTLEIQLEHLANEYRNRLNVLVASLAEVIKPMVILLAGGLFLFLIVALLLPVYDLVRQTVEVSMHGG
jgi:type II secretory pathway component PulF